MTSPSPGALRAAQAIAALEYEAAKANQQNAVLQISEVAQIIDRESGVPELINGCNALLGLLQLVAGRRDIDPEIKRALTESHRIEEAETAIERAAGATAITRPNPNASVKQAYPKGRYS